MYSKPWLLFWIFVICCHLYFDYSLYRRLKGWARGKKKPVAATKIQARVIFIWLAEVFLQRQLLSLSVFRWIIHQGIFWGFLALTMLSLGKFILLLLNLSSLDRDLHDFFATGSGYLFTKLWGDFFGLLLLAGCTGVLLRRILPRAERAVQDQADFSLVLYLLFMTLSGFALEGMSLATAHPEAVRYAFMGRLFMPSLLGIEAVTGEWHFWIWVVHSFSGAAILLYLPHSKLVHSILAPLVIGLNAAGEHGRKDMYWPKTKQFRAAK